MCFRQGMRGLLGSSVGSRENEPRRPKARLAALRSVLSLSAGPGAPWSAGSVPQHRGVMVHICNPSSQEVEAQREIQGHS